MVASQGCCRLVICTSTIRISRWSMSQRWSIGLRCGDCGGCWSTVKGVPEPISRWWKYPAEDGYTGPEGMDTYPPNQNTGWFKAGWIHAFMLFFTIFWPDHWIVAPDQATFSSILQFRWSCENCCLTFTFLPDRSDLDVVYSGFHDRNKGLFESLLLYSCYMDPVWPPLTSTRLLTNYWTGIS